MNRKALVLAAIFLAAALASPVLVLIVETNADQKDIDQIAPNLADETQVSEYLHAINERHQTVLIILAIVEAAFVILFAVALWFAFTT
jgi:peptidoglycan/LPS O-acetylase OafA/YrhL